MRRLNPGRFAACLYLFASAAGFFSYMIVTPKLIATADAAATARNVLASETLFRLSVLCELISSIAFIFLVLALYRLFRDVDRSHAIAMVVLVLVSIPVSLFNVVNEVAALRLLKGGGSLVAMSQSQLQGLAMMFLRLHGAGLNIAAIFWGLWLLPLGVLIRRSGFVPRILGTLLLFNGIAYPAVTVIWLMLPDYTSIAARVALIPELGEAWLMLWLLIKGIPARAGDQPARGPERTAIPQLAGVLLLAIATLCPSAKAQTSNAAAVYENGRAALAHGDPERGARQSLAEFYAMAPAMMGGSESMAREQAAQIAKRDAIEGHRAYARIYTATNRPDLARIEYAEMLKTDGRSARAHYWLGTIYEKQHRNAEARERYAASLRINPTQKDVQMAQQRVAG